MVIIRDRLFIVTDYLFSILFIYYFIFYDTVRLTRHRDLIYAVGKTIDDHLLSSSFQSVSVERFVLVMKTV